MNDKQRIIVATAFPILAIIVALGLAEKVGAHYDNWEETWWVWASAVLAVSGIEWWLFRK